MIEGVRGTSIGVCSWKGGTIRLESSAESHEYGNIFLLGGWKHIFIVGEGWVIC